MRKDAVIDLIKKRKNYDEIKIQRAKKLKIGNGMDEGVDLGPK